MAPDHPVPKVRIRHQKGTLGWDKCKALGEKRRCRGEDETLKLSGQAGWEVAEWPPYKLVLRRGVDYLGLRFAGWKGAPACRTETLV